MPSQQYEPPNREATTAGRPDGTAASRPDENTEQRPDRTGSGLAQDQPTREQPAQPSPSGEQTPGTQSLPAYGAYGAAPPYDEGSDRSQREDTSRAVRHDQAGYPGSGGHDQPGQSYGAGLDDPNRNDPNGYDPNRNDPSGDDPNRDAVQPADSDAVRAREKEAFGGVKVGAAFFGWLTAVGATVILVAIVAAVASALDLGTVVDGGTSSEELRSLGIGAAIAVLVVLFLAYYCGGYVAGRMARFNGVRQGIAVWLWAVLIAAVVTGIGLLADDNSDLANDLNLPNVPVDSSDITSTSLIALAIVLGVTLIGAILGGLAGMRFHRRVDRAGFAPDPY